MDKTLLRQLKKQCHHLKPVIWIGQNGLSDNIMAEIDTALDHHELIKIKIGATDKAGREAIGNEICEKNQAEPIQSIGQMFSIYRKKPEQH